jgi:hypothetical protein
VSENIKLKVGSQDSNELHCRVKMAMLRPRTKETATSGESTFSRRVGCFGDPPATRASRHAPSVGHEPPTLVHDRSPTLRVHGVGDLMRALTCQPETADPHQNSNSQNSESLHVLDMLLLLLVQL